MWNQYYNIQTNNISRTANNVTIVDNRDGSYTISTTAAGASAYTNVFRQIASSDNFFYKGHYVYISAGGINIDRNQILIGDDFNGGVAPYYTLNGVSGIYQGSLNHIRSLGCAVLQNAVFTTPITIKPQFIDLTQMFGTDAQIAAALGVSVADITSQAAVDAFEAMFPADYYPYNAGELLNVNADGIKATDPVLGTSTVDISSWQNLKDPSDPTKLLFPYGLCSAGDVHDEVSATTAIKRVGVYAIKDYTFNMNTTHIFSNGNLGYRNCVSNKYKWQGYLSSISKLNDMCIGRGTVTAIFIRDDSCNSPTDFINNNQNTYIYSPLKTPIELHLPTRQDYSYPLSLSTTESVVPDNRLLSAGWNQLVQNGDFSNGSSGWSTRVDGSVSSMSVTSKKCTFQKTTSTYGYIYSSTITPIINHIYYYSAFLNIDSQTSSSGELGFGFTDTMSNTNYGYTLYDRIHNKTSNIYKITSNSTNAFDIRPNNVFVGTCSVWNVNVVDLTQMFGTDAQIAAALGCTVAEITTSVGVAAFDRLFPADYYPYNAGQQLYLYPTKQYYEIPASPSVGETKPYTAPVITTNNYSIHGSLPTGYTQLEYIESTGTQCIDTGVAIDKTLRWEIDNEFTGVGSYGQGGSYNGCYDSNVPICRFDIGINTAWLYMSYGLNNYKTIDIQQNILNHRLIYKLDAKNMQYSYGQTIGTIPSYTDTASKRTKTIYLFARNDSGGRDRCSLQKTYSSKFYQNDVLIQNLLPCINPNGVVGMYDTVTHTFFGNEGTGDFIAGPIVS